MYNIKLFEVLYEYFIYIKVKLFNLILNIKTLKYINYNIILLKIL